MTDAEIINVDTEFLAKCLGLDAWPKWKFLGADIGPAYLGNWRLRYAARVITDANRRNVSANIAIHNAEVWISRAYEKGRQVGIRQERDRWESRIKDVFGL